MSDDEKAQYVDAHGKEKSYNKFLESQILQEMSTRDRRWLYDGKPAEITYLKPKESLHHHEIAGIEHLSKAGIRVIVGEEDPTAIANIDLIINGRNWEMKNVTNSKSSVSNQIKRARIKWYKLNIKSPCQVVFTCEDCHDDFKDVVKGLEERRHEGEEFLIISYAEDLRRLKDK